MKVHGFAVGGLSGDCAYKYIWYITLARWYIKTYKLNEEKSVSDYSEFMSEFLLHKRNSWTGWREVTQHTQYHLMVRITTACTYIARYMYEKRQKSNCITMQLYILFCLILGKFDWAEIVSTVSMCSQTARSLHQVIDERSCFNLEFDPSSGWMLAAWMRHASRMGLDPWQTR